MCGTIASRAHNSAADFGPQMMTYFRPFLTIHPALKNHFIHLLEAFYRVNTWHSIILVPSFARTTYALGPTAPYLDLDFFHISILTLLHKVLAHFRNITLQFATWYTLYQILLVIILCFIILYGIPLQFDTLLFTFSHLSPWNLSFAHFGTLSWPLNIL